MNKICFSIFLLLFASLSHAEWAGDEIGQVESIHITGGGNYDLRVVLKGQAKLCSTDTSWAFLNESDHNYSSYLSVLLSAQASGKKVQIYTNKVGSYCKIGYLTIF